jgi:hypothetical protein
MALWQSSFTIRLRICVRTVLGDWRSLSAMPLRSKPLTIRLSTWCSRAVSCAMSCGGPAGSL